MWAPWDGHLPPVMWAEERSRDNLKTETSDRRHTAETLWDAHSPFPRSDYILLP